MHWKDNLSRWFLGDDEYRCIGRRTKGEETHDVCNFADIKLILNAQGGFRLLLLSWEKTEVGVAIGQCVDEVILAFVSNLKPRCLHQANTDLNVPIRVLLPILAIGPCGSYSIHLSLYQAFNFN